MKGDVNVNCYRAEYRVSRKMSLSEVVEDRIFFNSPSFCIDIEAKNGVNG